jgi:hypothetical protein
VDQQLIIKFWRKSLDNETFLTTIEDELTLALGNTAQVDGYDVSAKEINLFVLTSDPRHAFRRIKVVLEKHAVLHAVSAASRLVGGARFTSLWPLRVMRRFTLPTQA